MAKTFRAVTVSTLSNNGQSAPKYNKPVALNINYDPQGLSVELISGTVRGETRRSRPIGTVVRDGDDAADGDATDRSRDATDRYPDNITTLPVTPGFFFPFSPRLRVEASRTTRPIAGRYHPLPIPFLLPRFMTFRVFFSLECHFLCCRASFGAIGANCTCLSSCVVPTPIINRYDDSFNRILLFTR